MTTKICNCDRCTFEDGVWACCVEPGNDLDPVDYFYCDCSQCTNNRLNGRLNDHATATGMYDYD